LLNCLQVSVVVVVVVDFNCFVASEGNANVFKSQNQPRKQFLEEALGLCAVANKRERKERREDEQTLLLDVNVVPRRY